MIVREVERPLHLPPSETPRSEGIHISTVIRSIAGLTGILKKEWVEDLSLSDHRDITDPVSVLRINIGLAWEHWYIPKFLQQCVDHPGEMCYAGIYLTHDAEEVDVIITETGRQGYSLILHEVKATYKSTRTVGDLTQQWMYITQLKAYCKALGTRFAYIHILFLCGDYKYPIQPQHKVFFVEFSQEEIDTTWDMLMDYAKHRAILDEEERLAREGGDDDASSKETTAA